jgi:hypothetical protein
VGDVNFIEPSFTGKTDFIILRYSGTNSGPSCENRVWTDFNVVLYSVKNSGPPSSSRFETDAPPASAVVTAVATQLSDAMKTTVSEQRSLNIETRNVGE